MYFSIISDERIISASYEGIKIWCLKPNECIQKLDLAMLTNLDEINEFDDFDDMFGIWDVTFIQVISKNRLAIFVHDVLW